MRATAYAKESQNEEEQQTVPQGARAPDSARDRWRLLHWTRRPEAVRCARRPRPRGHRRHFETIGLKPGKENAIAAGVAETAGGALLALGLFTPVAGAMLVGDMVTAVRTVHLEKGPWLADGGFEYNLVLIAAVLAIVDAGKSGDSGAMRALLALLVGAAASTAVIEAGKRA